MRQNQQQQRLVRELGVSGAVMMGLGSIVGTGVFVSTGLAAGVAGPAVVLAVVLAAALAACNGLSSAQLAAAHPVSGGTYEYGYTYLHPLAGFIAGWMFLAAKSASAATAALGFAGYLLTAMGMAGGALHAPVALAAAGGLTLLVLSGLRRTNVINITVVSITLVALAAFVAGGVPVVAERGSEAFVPFFAPVTGEASPMGGLLHATALMFVAYTGYGRIATLGEEIRDPARNIPIAIIVTLVVTAVLYIAVVAVGVGVAGAADFYQATTEQAAPLEVIARGFGEGPWTRAVVVLVSVGAITAMLGVLLNLILGLSRVALAMGRRGDLPRAVGELTSGGTPAAAIVLVAAIVALLATLGSVKAAWSFSAFTVLVYYGLTNAAALRLPTEARLYPRWIAWVGLLGCAGLAFWVEPIYWGAGLGVIGVGVVWFFVARRVRSAGRREV